MPRFTGITLGGTTGPQLHSSLASIVVAIKLTTVQGSIVVASSGDRPQLPFADTTLGEHTPTHTVLL